MTLDGSPARLVLGAITKFKSKYQVLLLFSDMRGCVSEIRRRRRRVSLLGQLVELVQQRQGLVLLLDGLDQRPRSAATEI